MRTIAVLRSSFESFALWLRDEGLIYGYRSQEKAQTCFKDVSAKREQDGDLIGITIPRFCFIFHSYVNRRKMWSGC